MGIAGRRVHRYLLHALALMESDALHRADLDWPAVRADAVARCAGAVTYAETHTVLAEVLRRAGGPHSGLRPPRRNGTAPTAESSTAEPPVAEPPTAEPPTDELAGGVARLRIPGCAAGRHAYREAGRRLVRALASAEPAGWIVDLRGNRGGNMRPMLAVVAPLLPDGVLGHFVPPERAEQTWELRRGRILLAGRVMDRAGAPPGRAADRPLAVLTDGLTASSGEAVAVAFRARPGVRAFGAPTSGMTSANQTHRLRDGALLHLTVAYFADRARTVYRGPLPVDGPAGAAEAWLRRCGG
ncbi:S41 family peptidase [Dactylosporangium sp. CA-052675]|uniref:S41 family peptidase n=1 Tax=Dactylosporangium sp. CA-052675 TaxID=3239927 RepID=UPI003D92B67F